MYSYVSAVIHFITLSLAADQIPTSRFDRVIGRFEKDPRRGRLIGFVLCTSALSKRNEGERTSKRKEVDLSPSADLSGRRGLKWTGARKSTVRHQKGIDQWCKKLRNRERVETEERGRMEKGDSYAPPPQRNGKTKGGYEETLQCLQMH